MTSFTQFHVKPFIALDSGSRIYGAGTTTSLTFHPVIGNSPTKTQTEETAWTGVYGAAIEVNGSDQLALKEGQTYGEYVYDFDHTEEIFGDLWVEPTWLFLVATELYVFDATMDVFDADFPVTGVINAEGVPQIEFWIALDGTGDYQPLVESDYKFTTAKIKVIFTRKDNDSYRPALSGLTTFQNVPDFML